MKNAVPKLQLFGTRGSPATYAIRDFLTMVVQDEALDKNLSHYLVDRSFARRRRSRCC
jgi:hypothetical protein